jgi:hypothetical protein
MTRARRADQEIVTSRALALLASLASPIFMAAAVAAWLLELWPANSTTLCIAGLMVLSGPLLGQVHVATASARREHKRELEPTFATTMSAPISNKEARARAFHNWRDSVNPAIELRERERRASQWIRS